MYLKHVLTLFLLISLGGDLCSQPIKYSFQHINNNNGLSNNSINCILKDSKGFMWFGSASGLNRYDGYNMKKFFHSPTDSTSIRDNFIENLAEDANGMIWIGAGYGYDLYDPRTESFIHNYSSYLNELDISHQYFYLVKQSSNKNIWFITYHNGVYLRRFDLKKTLTIQHHPYDPFSIYSDTVQDVVSDKNGNAWLIYKSGVLDLLDLTNMKVVYRNLYLQNIVKETDAKFRLFVDNDNDLWVTSYNLNLGVYYLNSNHKILRHIDSQTSPWRLNTDGARVVCQDLSGKIWIATDPGGINILDKKDSQIIHLMHRPDDKFSISQNSITYLYKDDLNIIWVGTYKQGVSFLNYNASNFAHFKKLLGDPKSLPISDIDCFIEDKHKNIWIGTNGGGIIYWNRKNDQFTQYKNIPGNPNSLSSNVILCFFIDKSEDLWIGTYMGGLNMFDGKKFTHYRHSITNPNSLSDNRVWSIFQDSRKNMWIGTLGAGVDKFDPKTSIFHHYPKGTNSLFDSYVLDITEDKDERIWFGTSYGISLLDLKTNSFSNFLPNYKEAGSNNITRLMTDRSGNIWIGTRNGLARYDGKHKYIKFLYESDGLPSNFITGIVEAPNGEIWVSSTNGISNIKSVQSPSNGSYYQFTFTNFDETDGLQGKEFNANAAYVTSYGEIMFGGSNGFNIFRPNEIKKNSVIPQLVFTDFEIFYTSVPVGKKINGRIILPQSISYCKQITLKHNEKIFSIEFSALSYLNSEKNKYKYKLEGFNNDWVISDSKNRKITYTNLNPGTYIFKVTGSNNDELWNPTPIALAIKILPPWWKTWWFISLLIGLGLVLILGLFQFRLSVYKGMAKELRRLVKERTTELEEKNHLLTEGATRIEGQAKEIHAHAENLKVANTLLIEKNELIQEQSQKLEESNQQLSVLNATKDRIFSIIAHDLRNPFHVVSGFSEIILHEINELPTEKLQEYITIINETSINGNNLLENLLQWSRTQTGGLNFYPEKLRLHSIAMEIIKFLRGDAERKKINLLVNFDTSINVTADENMLKTILRNLTSNAIKFTPVNGSITIEAIDVNNMIEICVKDTGVGISKERQDLLFKMESNISTRGTSNESGTGLGLIICHEFVQKQGGEIWIESELDQGSRFKFTIPKG
jgi:signal transduction histidine kinase/ligand-binding sensor domain-containing protein